MKKNKTISIKFVDFWNGFKYEDFLLYKVIQDICTNINKELIVLKENVFGESLPDFLIYSNFGYEHLNTKYNKVCKIYWSGENTFPNFNECDYAIGSVDFGFEKLEEFKNRYLYYPYAYFSESYENVYKSEMKEYDLSKSDQLDALESLVNEDRFYKRKFISVVVSNSNFADPIREKFIKACIERYPGKVDSAGHFLNNMPNNYTIENNYNSLKNFLSQYKFNICFENSQVKGYLTEKIFQAYDAKTIPIYFGDDENLILKNHTYIKVTKDDLENNFENIFKKIDELNNNKNEYINYLKNCKIPLSLIFKNSKNNWPKNKIKFYQENPIIRVLHKNLYYYLKRILTDPHIYEHEYGNIGIQNYQKLVILYNYFSKC